MYQKEFENIIILACNKHSPERLVKHILTEVGLLDSLQNNSIDIHFEFHSGRKIQAGYFATCCEIASIINESENEFVKKEQSNLPKWKDFLTFFIEPIKQRYKDGLLAPQSQGMNEFSNFDSKFDNNINFKGFDQEKELTIDEKPVPDPQKKIPMKEFLKISSIDYQMGKKSELQPVYSSKKDDNNEMIHEDEDDHYQSYLNEMTLHNKVISNYDGDKTQPENHEFYDNNYWSPHVVVDEVSLEELTQSLL